MRKLCLLLAALLVLTVGAAAQEVPEDFSDVTLETLMEQFRQDHGLTEKNFAISYYNTVTGESYAWNDTWFSIAASTYKLPLNMVFYEMQRDGEITGDTVITWTGQTLDYIHEQSIVHSNNELSEALMYYWGDHVTYKEKLRKYFTMTDEEIDPSYWQANWFCVRMMMDCLKYLYENQEDFEELIGYMKQAMPGQYFKRGVTEYEVAHKYGSVQWFNNDVGIIYTPQPFLLAVYTQISGIGGDEICADAAELLAAYTVWQGEQNPAQAEETEEQPQEPGGQHLTVQQVPVEKLPEIRAEEPEEPTQPVEETPDPAPAVQKETPVEPAAESRTAVLPVALAAVAALILLMALLRVLRRKRS